MKIQVVGIRFNANVDECPSVAIFEAYSKVGRITGEIDLCPVLKDSLSQDEIVSFIRETLKTELNN